MPQVDLETLVSVCGGGAAASDRKIACETLADGDQPPEIPNRPELSPDFPPESFWLSKDSEFDWFDRNAIFERKESTKGNSNSTSSNLNSNSNFYSNLNSNSNFYSNSNSNSSSQRFSKNLKSKASIIGLPKTQKTNYIDPNRRNCKPVNIRMFPKRSNSVGKSIIPMIEPSSPKVSCMGRVRSKRGRQRPSEPTKVKTKSKPSEPTKVKTKSSKKAEKTRTATVHRRSGFLGGFMSIFRSDRRKKPAVERDEGEQLAESPPRNSVTMKLRQIPISFEPVAEPPGLGGMMRFSSGRKSESWSADDLEVGMAISEIQNRPIEITV